MSIPFTIIIRFLLVYLVEAERLPCKGGILDSIGQTCCPQSCGICGGFGCHMRPGGGALCCGQEIVKICDNNDPTPPCRYAYPSDIGCFDAQMKAYRCCFEPELMPACFLGQEEFHSACCRNDSNVEPVPWPEDDLEYTQSEALCDEFLIHPMRVQSRAIIGSIFDIKPLCLEARSTLEQSPDEPKVFVSASHNYRELLMNFIFHFANQASSAGQKSRQPYRELILLPLDDETKLLCDQLSLGFATQVPDGHLYCFSPPRSSNSLKPTAGLGIDPNVKGDSKFYYAVTWLKPAFSQLMIDIGAQSILYMDIDVVIRKPLLKRFFHPRSHLIQTECSATQYFGPSDPGSFDNMGGLGFVSRHARKILEDWLALFIPFEAGPESVRIYEMEALRQTGSVMCLAVNAFIQAHYQVPLVKAAEHFRARLQELDPVTIHFLLPKEHLMKAARLWLSNLST